MATYEELQDKVEEVYRDWLNPGLPVAGTEWEPPKRDIRELLSLILITMAAGGFEAPPEWAEDLAEVLAMQETIEGGLATIAAAVTAAQLAKTEAEEAAEAAQAAAANAQAVSGGVAANADDAVQARIRAEAAADDAEAAASMTSIYKVYATKADATADLANIPADGFVMVKADESTDGLRHVYRKTGGVLVDQWTDGVELVDDQAGRPSIPPALLGDRSVGLHIRKALYDLRQGTRLSLRMLVLGDSLGMVDHPGAPEQLTRIFSGHHKNQPVYARTTASGALTGAADTGVPFAGNFTSTQLTKDATEGRPRAWGGTMMKFANSQYCVWSGTSLGGGMFCDRIRIYLPCEPGGPTFKVQFADNAGSGLSPLAGDADWENPTLGQIASGQTLTGSELLVSTDAADGMVCVELVMTSFKQWHLKLTQTTAGTGYALDPLFEVSTKSAVNTYRLSPSSNDPAAEVAGARPNMAALISNLQPDVIVVAFADPVAGYQTFLPMIEDALTDAALSYKPLVWVEGNGYMGLANDAQIIDRIAWTQAFCAPRLGWYVPDLFSVIGGIAEATREGVNGDNLHPTAASWSLAYDKVANDVGLVALPPSGMASAGDAVRRIHVRAVPASVLPIVQASPAVVDTGLMTWSKLASSAAAAAVTTGAANAILIETAATASNKVTAYVNDALNPVGPANGLRSLSRDCSAGFKVRPGTANTTGVLYIVSSSDRSYNSAYTGALTGGGYGFVIENNVAYGVCWNSGAQFKTATGVTLGSTGWAELQLFADAVGGGSTTGTIEWWVNGETLGTSAFLASGNASPFRFEQTNGATAAQYSNYVTGPIVAVGQLI